MMYYQIIRADGSSKNYKIFSEMLDDFDRQDVIDLHRLVNERYETTSPEGYDLLLWGDLKTLFEPNEEDEIWKNQQDYNLISWRLFDSCGVHVLLMNTGVAIHMMIEKKYPLTQEMLSRMLNRRLEVDYESEMAFELLRFTRSQLQNLGEDCWELKASEVTTRKYCIELLYEYGLLAARPVNIPLPENFVPSFKETANDKYLSDFTTYQNLFGKLIYLTNTRPDISYDIHYLSQHMYSPLQSHFKVALRVLRYLKGKTLVLRKSKKQPTISKSSSEAEYRIMSSASCEVVWLSNLLHSIGLKNLYHVELFCDNSSAIQIAANPVLHERTKHFELDVHF
ncbi:ribonuclease H-like domain-containing protein [Tanacetum coccineum]